MYFIPKHVSLAYLLCSIQLRPARHKRGVEQIFRQLSVPLCHGPTGSQCRGRGHLQELSAQTVVPFKPVILRDSSRYSPSFAEVFSRQLKFSTSTTGTCVCLCCEFCLFGLATARQSQQCVVKLCRTSTLHNARADDLVALVIDLLLDQNFVNHRDEDGVFFAQLNLENEQSLSNFQSTVGLEI